MVIYDQARIMGPLKIINFCVVPLIFYLFNKKKKGKLNIRVLQTITGRFGGGGTLLPPSSTRTLTRTKKRETRMHGYVLRL